MSQNEMRLAATRRLILKSGAGSAALGALGIPLEIRRARAQGGFDWKRFSGQKIEVLLAKGPRGDLLQKYESEFTEMTGIEVGSEQVPEQQQRQKAVIEFTSGATSFDALMLALHVQKRLVAKGQWLVDLRKWLEDPAMTSPDYDFADFSKPGLLWATQADGRIDTLPINIDYHLLYCNQELFEKKGVAYPQTFDEMQEAAKALHDPANGVTGWIGRGLKNANVPVWTNFLLGWDVDSIDAQGQMHTTEDAGGGRGPALQDHERRLRAAGLERLQLDGEPGELHAGPCRHVARRHRLLRAGRGQDQVARRRPGAVRHAAQGAEGAALRLVRRRHGRVGLLREARRRPTSTASGRPASPWRRASSRAATARRAAAASTPTRRCWPARSRPRP